MSFLYSVQQVRDAENVLLTQQTETDELMRSAARAVADEARRMLPEPPAPDEPGMDDVGLNVLSVLPEREGSAGDVKPRVLLLVGPGGNGGDALYAGRDLLQNGYGVTAYAIAGRDKTYTSAREAYLSAGGTFVDELGGGLTDEPAQPYDLVIDGLFGLGNRGGIGEKVAEFLHWSPAPVLAIDIPSGVAGDSGAVPPASNENLGIADHVRADVTVTFGGLRRAHGLSAECGRVVCRDIQLLDGQSLHEALLDQSLKAQMEGDLSVNLCGPPAPISRGEMPSLSLPFSTTNSLADTSPEPGILEAGDTTLPFDLPGEPGATSDKYTGGVVGICAGSGQYPGAGILATTAAVRATSSIVRWVGEDPLAIVMSNPEVVAHASVTECGRVQAWVVGPGRGTDARSAEELAFILDREEPVLVDADGLTLLAENPALMDKLKARGLACGDAQRQTCGQEVVDCAVRQTILTPHAGEFARLAQALDGDYDIDADRIGAASAMARELGCAILLKGRFTVITDGTRVDVVDSGSSWAATAGSGDVLAGIIGALLAERGRTIEAALVGQFIHAVAAYTSALVEGVGFAPTSASRIAEKIPEAIALLRCAD